MAQHNIHRRRLRSVVPAPAIEQSLGAALVEIVDQDFFMNTETWTGWRNMWGHA